MLFSLKCANCGAMFMPPKYVCAKCSSTNLKKFKLSGLGEIYTFTTIRVPPTKFQGQEPYDIAIIKLKEGLKITARLMTEEGKKIQIGTPVSFDKKDEDEICWFKVSS